MGIHSIQIQNFKSIRDSGEILLKPINVLIGPNGAGKSNFIGFFKFLNKLFEQQLQLYVAQNGRADNFLYFGRKTSAFVEGTITFDNEHKNEYNFKLIPDQLGSFLFENEFSRDRRYGSVQHNDMPLPGGSESFLKTIQNPLNKYLIDRLSSFKVFHFNDTSFNAKVKQPSTTTDYAYLYEDGGNIAAFLYRLQQANSQHFKIIEKQIQSIAPFFDKFHLVPDEINPRQIFLRWLEKGSDQLFDAYNLSDGTLRMICLTTLLMQPVPPSTIIIDEPELGLHPFAITKLAAMLQSVSEVSQVIISTQSVELVNQFEADDIIVVERENNQTVFKRQSSKTHSTWLEDYSLGELWLKNVLGGRPK